MSSHDQMRDVTPASTAQDDQVQSESKSGLMNAVAAAAVAVACFLIVIKAAAFAVSGSVAVLGSLVDSVLDAFASVINLFAIRHSLQPADAEHRFGHGKVEALAGLGQSAFISGSAAVLLFESVSRFWRPVAVEAGMFAIGVIIVATVLTLGLVLFQRQVVQKTGSLAISADSLHYRGDLLMNVSVILALVLSTQMNMGLVDPLFGIAIAFYILWSAIMIFRGAYDQLMDRELPDDDREKIKGIVLRNKNVLDMHDLRTRASGLQVFIQMHLELDPNMQLLRAHEISDAVEQDILEEFPGAEVLIHQDPAGHEDPPSPLARS